MNLVFIEDSLKTVWQNKTMIYLVHSNNTMNSCQMFKSIIEENQVQCVVVNVVFFKNLNITVQKILKMVDEISIKKMRNTILQSLKTFEDP